MLTEAYGNGRRATQKLHPETLDQVLPFYEVNLV